MGARVDELNKLAGLQWLVEHCSANAEATGSNPEILFFGLFRNFLNCASLRWSYTHFICIPAVQIISFCESLNGRRKKKTVKKSLDRSRLFFGGCFRDRFAPTICPGVPRMRDQMLICDRFKVVKKMIFKNENRFVWKQR